MPFFINPMYNYPNINNIEGYNIKDLENKINNLEKEINNLKARILKLENLNHKDNYSNYNANDYNMM